MHNCELLGSIGKLDVAACLWRSVEGSSAVTELEWASCSDPTLMLYFLQGKTSDRKLRLFAVACCRRVWNELTDERSQRAVELAERAADEPIEPDRLMAASNDAADGLKVAVARARGSTNSLAAAAALEALRADDLFRVALNVSQWISPSRRYGPPCPEEIEQAKLLRQIVGNPFRPVGVDPAWRTPEVVRLAQTIYGERAFDRMAELADALEDAGCTKADVLRHCRDRKGHVRGCWVLDLLLGRP